MIISERHKGRTSTCDLKCDECGKIWRGNYYVWRKKNKHFCPNCSLKKGWKKKHKKNPKLIPDEIRPYIVKRLDGRSLDEHFPCDSNLKIIVRCPVCGVEKRSNAFNFVRLRKLSCNTCTWKERFRNGEYDYSYRQTDEYRKMMRKAIKNSKKYKQSIPLRAEITRKYWERVRGCKFSEIKDKWYMYRRMVYNLSEQSYKKYKNVINPNNLIRGRGKYHLDHRFTVLDGFKKNVLPYIVSHPFNLQMLPEKDNIAKDYRSEITMGELFEGIFGVAE